jgi:hypothetical protein
VSAGLEAAAGAVQRIELKLPTLDLRLGPGFRVAGGQSGTLVGCHKRVFEADAKVRSNANNRRLSTQPFASLIGRPDGIERVSGPNVHLALADCRSCVDVRVEFIDRQNLPIASSTQHDDLAMLAGDVNLAVYADR